jgi:HPt (histidine-containing phosphotransfer) domain-containing protein
MIVTGTAFAMNQTVTGMQKTEPALIDRAHLAILAEDVGPVLPAILETFRDEMRGRIVAMRRLLPTEDRQALADEAHTIKGTAAAMGFARLSADAKILERDAVTMTADQAGAQVGAIQRSFLQSCALLVELGHLDSIVPSRH